MAEFLDPSHQEHPLFNYIVYPDIGGTRYDFTTEVTRDSIIYNLRNPFSVTKLELPVGEAYMHVAVETLEGDRFLEAYYSVAGDLSTANFWFRRYCKQKDFIDNGQASEDNLATQKQLYERGADIMVEADIIHADLGLYLCDEDSDPDNVKIRASAKHYISSNGVLVKFHPDEKGEITPVEFYARLNDNTLSFGFRQNKNDVVMDHLSTYINMDRLYSEIKETKGKVTPGTAERVVSSVFLKIK